MYAFFSSVSFFFPLYHKLYYLVDVFFLRYRLFEFLFFYFYYILHAFVFSFSLQLLQYLTYRLLAHHVDVYHLYYHLLQGVPPTPLTYLSLLCVIINHSSLYTHAWYTLRTMCPISVEGGITFS